MGKAARERPKRLGEKLRQIRETLGLSQNEMIQCLGLRGLLSRNSLSVYEAGKREPSLVVLLKYARTVGIMMEEMVDDEVDLPDRLPRMAKRTRR